MAHLLTGHKSQVLLDPDGHPSTPQQENLQASISLGKFIPLAKKQSPRENVQFAQFRRRGKKQYTGVLIVK
jgi:hypothetical protein